MNNLTRIAMIAKTLILAETFHRMECDSLRDHESWAAEYPRWVSAQEDPALSIPIVRNFSAYKPQTSTSARRHVVHGQIVIQVRFDFVPISDDEASRIAERIRGLAAPDE
jgi:hypothetical protein